MGAILVGETVLWSFPEEFAMAGTAKSTCGLGP